MTHDELIEAIARKLYELYEADYQEHVPNFDCIDNNMQYWFKRLATTALNALRDTLKPWGYSVQEEAHPIISYITIEKPTEPAISITPLHALPEVNKHGA